MDPYLEELLDDVDWLLVDVCDELLDETLEDVDSDADEVCVDDRVLLELLKIEC
jgi:hypothetical protein